MKKNEMIQAFINALMVDNFVVVPDLLIEDFRKAADEIRLGEDEKPLLHFGGIHLLPNESKEYPLGGQSFYIE